MNNWLEAIQQANDAFVQRIDRASLPVERPPGQYAVVTCMDPRVNLAAIGIQPFDEDGGLGSAVRIIRTLGGVPEQRSLTVAIHLAGISEVAILMHTDCGAMAAWNRADVLIDHLRTTSGDRFNEVVDAMGGDDVDAARRWLRAFDDPHSAVVREVERLRNEPYIPSSVAIHGLVLDLTTGSVEIVTSDQD